MSSGDLVLTRTRGGAGAVPMDSAALRNMSASLRGSAFTATEVRLSGACARPCVPLPSHLL